MDLAGKVAVVTGGAMGIGFTACEALAAQGATILVADMKDAAGAAERLRKKRLQSRARRHRCIQRGRYAAHG